jgi:hypothetical protein
MLTIGKREDVEGIELPFVIVLARVPGTEMGNAVHAEDDGLAIDDEWGSFVQPGVLRTNSSKSDDYLVLLYGYRRCFRSHRRVGIQQRTV